METNTIKFLSLTGLSAYDAKIKEFIGNMVASVDEKSFKYVNLKDGVLEFYTTNPVVEGSTAAYSIELPEQDLSHLMALVKDATVGNIATFGDGGQVVDSGVKVADLATKTEVQEAKDAGTAAMSAVTALEEGQVAANKKAIGTLDDLETTAKEDLVKAINEVRNAVSVGGTAAAITVDTTNTTEGYLKSYTFKQGDNVITTVDIPKELMAVSGQVVVNPEGQNEGTYIELIIQNGDPVYVDVASLIENYVVKAEATQVQLAIDPSTREISATLVSGAVGSNELADSAVTTVKIADANVTKAKLSTEVQASLDKADAAATEEALNAEIERATNAEAQALADAKTYANDEVAKDRVRLDAIEAEETGLLAQAKAYADSKVEGVDLTGIATNAADIEALEKLHGEDKANLVAADEAMAADIAALKAIQHEEISTDEINAMFE